MTGRPWRANMASRPLSKAATAAGTSASVIWRNVTMDADAQAEGKKAGRRRS